MNGFERLKEQIKDPKDLALMQTVNYLLSREDMVDKYLDKDKTVDEMYKYIKEKGMKHARNGWGFITNEVVYAWAVMYFSLPNAYLKIKTPKTDNKDNNKQKENNNVISYDVAKKKLEEKKETAQISLFGGVINE